ncbi:hypothetical protein RJ639_019442 [Escallonia herrerae]|uniref:CCHC-type domain-containing protein n=1 Tax=Escallonia herrerae TaxID=1293975 RepID=A0AA89AJ48_9ASTE|nr:hypothetical protein RJ639_019442 [Escallonia herrerae]
MVANNFKKFLRFRRNDGRRQQNASNEENLCYKCHKPGHMKMDCPIYKREKKERRDLPKGEESRGSSIYGQIFGPLCSI